MLGTRTSTTGYKMTSENWGRLSITTILLIATGLSGFGLKHHNGVDLANHIFIAICFSLLGLRTLYKYVKGE